MLASRLHWRILVGTILALMAVIWLAPHWLKPPGIQENRILAKAPPWPKHLHELDDFRKGADAYVADNFPARPYLIGGINRLRLLFGVSGSHNVIIGRDGWLFFDDETHLGAARGQPPMLGPEVRQWLRILAGRTEYLQARHIPYLVVAAPTKEIIYPQYAPAWFGKPNPDRSTALLPRLARQAGMDDVFYLAPAVAEATRTGPRTYSRHDTHWNAYGAYAGYAALMSHLHQMGLTEGPKPLSDFVVIPGGDGNRPRDLALMLGVANTVHIDFPHIDNPAAEAKVQKTFLGPKTDWTAPQVHDTGEVGKPVLLMTRDSFSNEILPLLYPHFSRIILAHNQDGAWRPDLIERFKPDIVIQEVVEHGLRVSMGDGPPPSAEAMARIDKVLAQMPSTSATSSAAAMPTLSAPDAETARIVGAAVITGNCNLEIATLTPGQNGEATLAVSGWMSELTHRVTSPKGFAALKGPAGVLTGPLLLDKSRPDVATFFKNPSAEKSGFVGTYFIRKLMTGTYTPWVYRRAGSGWIACVGKQPLNMP